MFLFRPATSRHLWAPLARCTSYQSSTLLPAVFRHPLGLLLAGRPISILSSYRSLHKLETDANKLPQDAAKQVVLYQALNKADEPRKVILRFESNRFATSEEAIKEYLSALGAMGMMDRANLGQLYAQLNKASSPAAGQQQGSQPYFNPNAPQDGGAPHYSPPQTHYQYQLQQHQQAQQHQQQMFQQGQTSGAGGGGYGGGYNPQLGTDKDYPLHVAIKKDSTASMIFNLSMLFGLGVSAYFIYKLMSGGGLAASMTGENQVKEVDGTMTNTTFDDVKGCDEVKAELQDIVSFLRDPQKFTKLGGQMPKGLLLTGPPGTGKTLLAKAVAGEAGVPFFYASGSEFEEMFVGVGARRVRELFAKAKAKGPSIIFIDEIDAVGAKRSMVDMRASKMTLNQILVELDGFAPSTGVIVIAATNFPELLDKALIRPGRFDTQVTVPLPDLVGRKAILDLYLSKIKVDSTVDATMLARGTPGCTGAELFNMVNQAAVRAAGHHKTSVTMVELEYAKDKILMGAERVSAKMTEESRNYTAYHEGGHAIVAINTKGAHPVHKATIMPRGQALGMVHQLPLVDQYTNTREQLLARLDVCMGGRVAEEMIFGKAGASSGASSDIQQATNIAREMVLRYGMSDKVGHIHYDDDDLAKLSPDTRNNIDSEVKGLIEDAYVRAHTCLQDKNEDLHTLAKALLEHESLTGTEIDEVLKGTFVAKAL